MLYIHLNPLMFIIHNDFNLFNLNISEIYFWNQIFIIILIIIIQKALRHYY